MQGLPSRTTALLGASTQRAGAPCDTRPEAPPPPVPVCSMDIQQVPAPPDFV